MASVNKVILLGNLGQDPKTYKTQSGTVIAQLSLATSRKVKQPSGDFTTETEWHRVVYYGRYAEIARDYTRRGSPIYVEGRLRTRKWTANDGHTEYTTEVVGEVLQLLGSKQDTQRSSSSDGDTPF